MSDDIWGDDLLNVKARGETFTNLIKSIDDSKVISIEAGFGRGKTFFRQAWAKHLEAQGEVVVQIDAQKSDHSGDPVVTFIGALVQALGPDEKTRTEKAKDAGLKYSGMIGRSVMKLLLRSGADEVIEELTGKLNDAAGDMETLNNVVDDLGDGMSTLAGQMIASQMAAEQARAEEMPEQLDALRGALTKDAPTDRVVILIDELDRCHPDYVIALLEAMKLVFDRPGYVFCLMVNADYLQRMAEHRFGKLEDGWEYLEKFVDIRLSLGTTDEVIGEATRALVMEKLDIVGVPFGEGLEFTVERAAEVAAQMALLSGLSMRQIKRVLLKVEVALRCYQEVHLDLPLLVYLAFGDAIGGVNVASILPRAQITPEKAKKLCDFSDLDDNAGRKQNARDKFVHDYSGDVLTLNEDRYRLDPPKRGGTYYPWAKVLKGLAPSYIPEHRNILDAVHRLESG